MEPNAIKPARDHPEAVARGGDDDNPSVEVSLEDFNPEEYIEAILADLDHDVPTVEELARESQTPPPATMLPPPSKHAIEWVLEEDDRRPSRPAIRSVPPPLDDGQRFTFPPPISVVPPPMSSVAPVALLSRDEEDSPPTAPRPHRRRSELLLLGAFAVVGVAIVAIAGYDISRSTLWGASWQGSSVRKSMAAAITKVTPTTEPTYQLDSVVIRADRTIAALSAKQRLDTTDNNEIPFDPAAATMALDVASAEAMTRCIPAVGDRITARITFEPSGRVSSVSADATPDTSIPVKSCVQSVFSKVTIPRYTGEAMTFTRWLQVK